MNCHGYWREPECISSGFVMRKRFSNRIIPAWNRPSSYNARILNLIFISWSSWILGWEAVNAIEIKFFWRNSVNPSHNKPSLDYSIKHCRNGITRAGLQRITREESSKLMRSGWVIKGLFREGVQYKHSPTCCIGNVRGLLTAMSS